MTVGNLEEFVDENHCIVSGSMGPEYYVSMLSFVDKDQLEPGSSILMHSKSIFEYSNQIIKLICSYVSCRYNAR